jgi:hypothetical protein
MISFIKFLQVFDKYKGAGARAAIRNFGSGFRRQFNFDSLPPAPQHCLKGHGNDADFLGFLQKSVRHSVDTYI